MTNVTVDAGFAGVGYGIGKAGDKYIEEGVKAKTIQRKTAKAASYASNIHAGLRADAWAGGNYYQEKREERDQGR